MKKQLTEIGLFALASLSTVAFAQDAMTARTSKSFTSPNGLTELCVSMAKLPLGNYKKKDLAEEQHLCAIDFYNNTVALCAKTWSTSPGTIVRSIIDDDGKRLANDSQTAEGKYCNGGSLKIFVG